APAGGAAYLGGVPPGGARGPGGHRGGRQGPPASGHGLRGQEQGAEDAPGRNRETRSGLVIAAPRAFRAFTLSRERPAVTRVSMGASSGLSSQAPLEHGHAFLSLRRGAHGPIGRRVESG